MKKFIVTLITAVILLSAFSVAANAEQRQTVRVHGATESEIDNAILINGTTMVPVRTLAEVLGMHIMWVPNLETVVFWNEHVEVRAVVNEINAQVNSRIVQLAQAPMLIEGYTYMPLRNISEAANAEVVWNSTTNSIDLFVNMYFNTPAVGASYYTGINQVYTPPQPSVAGSASVFYSQRQPEWGFENNGRGYCWVCAYAMAMTSATGRSITPKMVADVNARKGSGSYMQHNDIAEEFGISFVSALPSDSEYFKSFDAWRGATYINASNDSEAIAAIKAALDKNPQGVMVRFTVYPHTLFAVGYSQDTIYFHEPAYDNGASMTFDQTCLKKYNISDLDYLQAIM